MHDLESKIESRDALVGFDEPPEHYRGDADYGPRTGRFELWRGLYFSPTRPSHNRQAIALSDSLE